MLACLREMVDVDVADEEKFGTNENISVPFPAGLSSKLLADTMVPDVTDFIIDDDDDHVSESV